MDEKEEHVVGNKIYRREVVTRHIGWGWPPPFCDENGNLLSAFFRLPVVAQVKKACTSLNVVCRHLFSAVLNRMRVESLAAFLPLAAPFLHPGAQRPLRCSLLQDLKRTHYPPGLRVELPGPNHRRYFRQQPRVPWHFSSSHLH